MKYNGENSSLVAARWRNCHLAAAKIGVSANGSSMAMKRNETTARGAIENSNNGAHQKVMAAWRRINGWRI
jgi:hypothetical protein